METLVARLDAVIFDCDGTLVDSEVLVNEVLVEMVAEHGLVLSVAEAIAEFRGVKMTECVAVLEGRLGSRLPPDFIERFRERMSAAFRERLCAVDGAVDLIGGMRLPFCVASSGPRQKIELSLTLTGLLPFFKNAIFSSYEVGVWKPDPGLFLHAARTMGVEPSACAVVEDSLPGVQAGLAAGMQVYAFQPYDVDPRIPSNVRVIRRLSELNAHLEISR